MTPHTRGALVERICDAIKAAHPGTPARAIAAAAGCAPSDLSRFKAGERKMDVDELVALVDEYGAVAVLGPIAARTQCDVVAREAAPMPVLAGSAQLVEASAGLLGEAYSALADNHLSPAERESLLRRLQGVQATVARLTAELERGLR